MTLSVTSKLEIFVVYLGEGEVDARVALERRLHRLVVHLRGHHCRFRTHGAEVLQLAGTSAVPPQSRGMRHPVGHLVRCRFAGAVACSSDRLSPSVQACSRCRVVCRHEVQHALCHFTTLQLSDQSPTRLHCAGGLRLRRRQLPVVDGPVQHHRPLPLRHDVHLAGSAIALTHIQQGSAPSTQCHWPEPGKKSRAARCSLAWRSPGTVHPPLTPR